MVSFEQPEYTADIDALGTLRLLESFRDYVKRTGRPCDVPGGFLGDVWGPPPPQNERTPFEPRSPYAVSKVAAHWYAANYREAYDLFICNGILFNHESPRRGETFVTRKITRAAGRIRAGLQDNALPRQSRSGARLGIRRGLRRGDVAHAATGRA